MFLWPFRLAFRIVSLVVFGAVIYVLVSAGQVINASRAPNPPTGLRHADAVVVLGAATTAGAPGADFAGRLSTASTIYAAGLAPLVLVTGEGQAGSSTAAIGANWLAHNGVPGSAIRRLPADNEISGLAAARKELGAGSTVIVVTDAVDLLFSKDVANSSGLSAQVTPASGSKQAVYAEFNHLWRQATGLAAGRIIGFRHATWAAS